MHILQKRKKIYLTNELVFFFFDYLYDQHNLDIRTIDQLQLDKQVKATKILYSQLQKNIWEFLLSNFYLASSSPSFLIDFVIFGLSINFRIFSISHGERSLLVYLCSKLQTKEFLVIDLRYILVLLFTLNCVDSRTVVIKWLTHF